MVSDLIEGWIVHHFFQPLFINSLQQKMTDILVFEVSLWFLFFNDALVAQPFLFFTAKQESTLIYNHSFALETLKNWLFYHPLKFLILIQDLRLFFYQLWFTVLGFELNGNLLWFRLLLWKGNESGGLFFCIICISGSSNKGVKLGDHNCTLGQSPKFSASEFINEVTKGVVIFLFSLGFLNW